MGISISELFGNVANIVSAGLSDWSGMHPLLVHFPIVLFFIAPFFFIAAISIGQYRNVFHRITLVVLILGVFTTFLAVSSGEMASEKLSYDPEITKTLTLHYDLAELSRNIFFVLTLLFLLYLVFEQKILAKFTNKGYSWCCCIFLFSYVFALLVLMNAAHYGGKLVHQHGIHSEIFKDQK